jgi:hypothetical protein
LRREFGVDQPTAGKLYIEAIGGRLFALDTAAHGTDVGGELLPVARHGDNPIERH